MINHDTAADQRVRPLDIRAVASKIGLREDDLELYGRYKAKISHDVFNRLADHPQAHYVVVTSINPTPLGEGKTVTAIGLGAALNRAGHSAITCLRQASLGPALGTKGGAAGGGRAQLIPRDELTMHFTGDIHAVAAANNQCVAMVDNHVYHGNELAIDDVQVRRVMDTDDRALRTIVQGLGGRSNGPLRETGFDIAAASEVMALLALSRDPHDLRERLGRMVVAFDRAGRAVTAEDVSAAGCMAALLSTALKPNIVQNTEHDPVFVHAGPFGNIAHGCSSIIADRIATRLAEYVVTEAGFGADLGAEKIFNIKCRAGDLKPSAAVVVASVRALKMHGGLGSPVPGGPANDAVLTEDLPAVRRGCENLAKHIEIVRLHGVVPVVAVNRFPGDTDRELALVQRAAVDAGAAAAEVSDVYTQGGIGGRALADAVVRACREPSRFHVLYPDDAPLDEKIRAICTQVYGADGVDFSPRARKKIRWFTDLGYGGLLVCMAKTHLSLSADPKAPGRPRGFRVPVRDLRVWAGAGFVYALCGDVHTMPGLPHTPLAATVDIDERGRITGLR
jgi:formate--tetrahydrofolate ligase